MALLTNETAVITGGAQGLGLAIAELFVKEGARVVLGDLNLDAAEVAAKELGGPAVARAVRCDITSPSEVDTLIQAALDAFGALDILSSYMTGTVLEVTGGRFM
jgi:3-oxoacyl-[acyl-carrier protein] reductase